MVGTESACLKTRNVCISESFILLFSPSVEMWKRSAAETEVIFYFPGHISGKWSVRSCVRRPPFFLLEKRLIVEWKICIGIVAVLVKRSIQKPLTYGQVYLNVMVKICRFESKMNVASCIHLMEMVAAYLDEVVLYLSEILFFVFLFLQPSLYLWLWKD